MSTLRLRSRMRAAFGTPTRAQYLVTAFALFLSALRPLVLWAVLVGVFINVAAALLRRRRARFADSPGALRRVKPDESSPSPAPSPRAFIEAGSVARVVSALALSAAGTFAVTQFTPHSPSPRQQTRFLDIKYDESSTISYRSLGTFVAHSTLRVGVHDLSSASLGAVSSALEAAHWKLVGESDDAIEFERRSSYEVPRHALIPASSPVVVRLGVPSELPSLGGSASRLVLGQANLSHGRTVTPRFVANSARAVVTAPGDQLAGIYPSGRSEERPSDGYEVTRIDLGPDQDVVQLAIRARWLQNPLGEKLETATAWDGIVAFVVLLYALAVDEVKAWIKKTVCPKPPDAPAAAN